MKNLYMKISMMMLMMMSCWLTGGCYMLYFSKIMYIDIHMFSFGKESFYYTMVFDWMSMIFIGVVLFISGSVFIFSKSYMKEELYEKRFLGLVVLFVISMVLMVLSPNLISILLGWDGLGLVSYCLVIYYQNKTSYRAGMITILSNRVGDFGLVMGIIFMMEESWNIMMMSNISMLCMIMILMAAITKSAQFPFMAWLPAAMSAPTPVSALVHSSTLVTAGVYLLVRFNIIMESLVMSKILLFMALFTIILSGMCACFEQDMKKIVAMSTLSQLGFMMSALALGFWEVAYFHMLTHALFKSMLFLSVGDILHSFSGTQDMRFMGGVKSMGMSSGIGVLISSMCLMGIPFVSGFYSKEMILKKIMENEMSQMLWIFMMIGVILTMIYSLRLIKMSILLVYMGKADNSMGEVYESLIPILVLGIMSIISGSMIQWMCFEGKEEIFVDKNMGIMLLNLIILMIILNFLYEYKKTLQMNMKKNFFTMMNLTHTSMICGEIILKTEPSNLNDEMWGEIMGAEGLYYIMMNGLKLVMMQMIEYKYQFLLFFLLLVIFW